MLVALPEECQIEEKRLKRIEEFKRSVELKNRALGMADDARAKAIDDKVQERAKFKGWGQDYIKSIQENQNREEHFKQKEKEALALAKSQVSLFSSSPSVLMWILKFLQKIHCRTRSLK